MENNAVYECSVTTGQRGLVLLTKRDEQDNKSNCRPSWLLKGETMRWTSEIRDNKGKMCTANELAIKTNFVERDLLCKIDVESRQYSWKRWRVMIIKQSSNIIGAQEMKV